MYRKTSQVPNDFFLYNVYSNKIMFRKNKNYALMSLENRRQDIKINADPFYWRMYSALRGDELTHWPPTDLNKILDN